MVFFLWSFWIYLESICKKILKMLYMIFSVKQKMIYVYPIIYEIVGTLEKKNILQSLL